MVQDVQFEIDVTTRPKIKQESSKLTRFIMNHSGGLIKDENRANLVSVGFVVLSVIISLILIMAREDPSAEKPGLDTFKNAPAEIRMQIR